jgi:hypothetical protein
LTNQKGFVILFSRSKKKKEKPEGEEGGDNMKNRDKFMPKGLKEEMTPEELDRFDKIRVRNISKETKGMSPKEVVAYIKGMAE